MADSPLGTSTLELRTDDTGLKQGLASAKSEIGLFQSFTIGFVSGFVQELTRQGFALIGDAVSGTISTVRGFITEAANAEDGIVRLNAALLASKDFTTADSESFQDFANSLQAVTKQSGEAILNVEQLFVSMGATHTAQVQRMTRAALDLSEALGIDLETAARALGRAMQGNTDALAKFGIQADATKRQSDDLAASLQGIETQFGSKVASEAKQYAEGLLEIERGYGNTGEKSAALHDALVRIRTDFNQDAAAAVQTYAEQNLKLASAQQAGASASEKFEAALKEIEERFGGQAGAGGNTFNGLVARAANAIDDFRKGLGQLITESPFLRGVIEGVQGAFERLSGWLATNAADFKQWVDTAMKVAVAGVQQFLDKVGAIAQAFDLASIKIATEGIRGFIFDITKSADDAQIAITLVGNTWTNVKSRIEAAGIKPELDKEGALAQLEALEDRAIAVLFDTGNKAGAAFVDAFTSKVVGIAGDIAAAVTDPTAWANAGSNAASYWWNAFKSFMAGAATPGTPASPGGLLGGFETGAGSPSTPPGGIAPSLSAEGLANFQTTINGALAGLSIPPIEIPVMASGSPSLPFSDYFGQYVPSVLHNLGYMTFDQTIQFNTNLGSALDIARQGMHATISDLNGAIITLRSMLEKNGPFANLGDDLRTFSSGLRNTDPQNVQIFADNNAFWSQAKDLLGQLVQRQTEQLRMGSAFGVEQLAVARDQIRATHEVSQAVVSPSWGGTIAASLETAIRRSTGDRGFTLVQVVR
jgi:hypothetical protein